MAYSIEFYDEPGGRKPVLEWIRHDLNRSQRSELGFAMREILQEQGIQVCGTSFGRHLGDGLFEFRLRGEQLLLRVFCHSHAGEILLLGGYDKLRDPSDRRQTREIAIARGRLTEWQARKRD